jgi:hypothetical protein
LQCGLQIWTIGFEPLNGNELRSKQYHKVEEVKIKRQKGAKQVTRGSVAKLVWHVARNWQLD